MASAKEITREVFELFRVYGRQDYLGEAVTQVEHAVQCAMLAEKDESAVETVLGALLHDIGHLSGQAAGQERMVTDGTELGVQKHDAVGREFLHGLGVPAAVTKFARGHVDAKRYLTYKNKEYNDNLSEASKMTLAHQGGPMTADEAAVFEKQPDFTAMLKMRRWDEQAKDPHLKITPLSKYEEMFHKYLSSLS